MAIGHRALGVAGSEARKRSASNREPRSGITNTKCRRDDPLTPLRPDSAGRCSYYEPVLPGEPRVLALEPTELACPIDRRPGSGTLRVASRPRARSLALPTPGVFRAGPSTRDRSGLDSCRLRSALASGGRLPNRTPQRPSVSDVACFYSATCRCHISRLGIPQTACGLHRGTDRLSHHRLVLHRRVALL